MLPNNLLLLSIVRVVEVRLKLSRNAPAQHNSAAQAAVQSKGKAQRGANASSPTAPACHLLLIHPCNKVSLAYEKSPKSLIKDYSGPYSDRAGWSTEKAIQGKTRMLAEGAPLLLARPPSMGTALAAKRHFGETRAEAALRKHAHCIGPGGSSPTQEGKWRVENNPALGSFVLFVWLCVFDTASPTSVGKLFCSVGSFRVGFGWPILQGDPCELLKAQMENKHRLIPPQMGKKGLEQLR